MCIEKCETWISFISTGLFLCFVLQSFVAESMLIMATVIHLGKSGIAAKVRKAGLQWLKRQILSST